MPSAYTAKIHDGAEVTFPEFAMTCARAFGALIEMRDEPLGAEIPDAFEPSPFYAEMKKEALARLAEARAWTPGQADAEAASHHAATVARIEKSNADARDCRERYAAMAADAEAWEPPTPDHEELKRFMLQQLHESIRFDCHELEIPAALSGPAYRAQVIADMRAQLIRARKHQAEEAERARERTEWIRALRASLPTPAAATGATS